jgi:hypothetical protein
MHTEHIIIENTRLLQGIAAGSVTQLRIPITTEVMQRMTDRKIGQLPYFPKDIIWVKEEFGFEPCWSCPDNRPLPEYGCTKEVSSRTEIKGQQGCIKYRAAYDSETAPSIEWSSASEMTRELSRFDLYVKSVRVESLFQLTIPDTEREGLHFATEVPSKEVFLKYQYLWDNEHKEEFQFDRDPWTLVIEFQRIRSYAEIKAEMNQQYQ